MQTILIFKAFIYNNNNKIIYNFCICGGITLPSKMGNTLPYGQFFNYGNFKKNISKYAKLMIELFVCGNLN